MLPIVALIAVLYTAWWIKLVPRQPHRCLIVGPSWIGDMMMAQSLFMLLRQLHPNLRIDVLAPAWSKPLLAAMPEVKNALEFPLIHGELGLKKRYQFAKQLRTAQYNWAIVLPNSFKSALVPFWANIPVRTGYCGEMRYGLLNDLRHLDKQALTMTVQRFVALGLSPDNALARDIAQIPTPALRVTSAQREQVCTRFSLSPTQPLLALCPGAEYGSAKRWPEAHFATVAEKMRLQGWQVALLGSQKDQPICHNIMQRLTVTDTMQYYNLAGKTSLTEVLAILALANTVISNDSGLMHLAAAVGSKVIALYGSSDPNFTPPLSSTAHILSAGLSCSPCFKRECPLGHLACLQQISPAQVLSHLL